MSDARLMTDAARSEVPRSTALAPDAWRRVLPALVLLLGGVGFFFADSFRAMEQIWSRSETFAHAYVVPPIALWLIWRQRQALALQVPAPSPWLLLPFLALCLAWLAGQLVAVNAVTQLSATALLIAAVPLVLGWRVAMVVLFPLAYLFFAVPIGEFMIPPLMQSTADFTVLALRLSGVPVFREGLQFVIPSGSWSVVEACSGVRYLMASFMVGSLFAYLNYRSWQRRLVFALVSLAVPILANWLRAYMIVMLGHVSGNKLAVGADHLIYGWVFFGIVITVVFMIGARWSEAPAEPRAPAPVPGAVAAPAWHVWAVACAGLLAAAVPSAVLRTIDGLERTDAPQLAALASPAGGWRAEPLPDSPWKPAYPNPSTEAVTRWSSSAGPAVGLYLAYYRHQDANRKLVSSDNQLVTSKDKEWNPVATELVNIAAGQRTLAVRQTRLLRTDKTGPSGRPGLLAWQVYWVNGTWTANDHAAKLAGAWHRIRGHGDESAAVVLYADDSEAAPARPALENFLRANLDMIERSLRTTRDGR